MSRRFDIRALPDLSSARRNECSAERMWRLRPERCPTCHRRHKRSNPQNARYWLLLHAIADKVRPETVTYSAQTWHYYFRSRFLGCDEVKMPNGETLLIPLSTADLDIAEFNVYMEQVEHWAAMRDVWLEDLGT